MLQRSAALIGVALAAGLTASADFSYTTTQKMTGGTMAAMAGTGADRTSKLYYKGQKMMTTTGDVSIIMDFGAPDHHHRQQCPQNLQREEIRGRANRSQHHGCDLRCEGNPGKRKLSMA